MKLPNRLSAALRKLFSLSLLLGIAGAGLSGCDGTLAEFFPGTWNFPDSPMAANRGTVPASLDAAGAWPSVPSGPIGGLQRQADCSLTYFDFSYASGPGTMSVRPYSEIPRYEKTLHDAALLKSTPDRFSAGCADPSQGITSRPFLFLGTGKNGRELAALSGASGVVTSGLKTDGTFTPPTTQETPAPSISLVSGDLNKDGNADLISINSNGVQSSVTVFLGRDDGSYQPGVDYGLPGANAQYAVLDDLNGDGILDLLVSSDSPAFAFSIFIGNGDGTFQPPQMFTPINTGVHSSDAFVTSDVNGDGTKDIVTAQGRIFLGARDGVTYTIVPQAAFPASASATNRFAPSIVAADFNNDGKVDIATDDGSTIRIYLGNGDGTFSAGPEYSTIANYGFLAATDLDGDGNIDLWTGYGGNGVYSGDAYIPNLAYALMGNGDGTFQGVSGLPGSLRAAASSVVRRPVSNVGATLILGAPSPGKVTVVAGQNSPSFTINVSSPNSTAQTVTFACSGLPVMSTCMFQPEPFALTASVTAAPVTVTIGTTANTVVTPARRFLPPSDWTNPQRCVAIVLLALSIGLFRKRRRKIGRAVSAGLLLVVMTSLAGCTNGKTSSTTTFNGTPPGTYAVTVTGLGAVTASTPSTLTLVVTSP